jgi:hypothetical protein
MAHRPHALRSRLTWKTNYRQGLSPCVEGLIADQLSKKRGKHGIEKTVATRLGTSDARTTERLRARVSMANTPDRDEDREPLPLW